MEIKGRVHCLFEQSGTFKNEFLKLGILELVQDCKDWVEDTPENADKWLARHGFPQADASDFESEFESESDCMIVDLKSK